MKKIRDNKVGIPFLDGHANTTELTTAYYAGLNSNGQPQYKLCTVKIKKVQR
jgi:hypothetical protein